MTHQGSELAAVLTSAEPLGPIAHEWINDSFADELIDDQIVLFRELAKPHMLFLGRKGAGKSAILGELRRSINKGRGGLPTDQLPPPGSHFVLPVFSWRQFHQIIKSVHEKHDESEIYADMIPSEHFIELWTETLWDQIILFFYEYAHHDKVRAMLEPVVNYVNADAPRTSPPELAAKKLFRDAKESVISFLREWNSTLYFLFDSMDCYPVRSPIFTRVLTGMFQGLTIVSHETKRIVISFCIPEEIEKFLAANSANLMKDYASLFRIRWKPIDLIKIVAFRLKASARIHDTNFYTEIEDLNLNAREDIHKLFSLVLPEKIVNSHGYEEDSLAYVIRHTQLLPRHVLKIFNAAFSEQLRATGSFRNMNAATLRKGVGEAQRTIADEILNPYQRIYPKLIAEARKILPDLEPICDRAALQKVSSRFNRMIEDDITVDTIWQTFFDMGVLGRSLSEDGGSHHGVSANSRYCYGQFHFNADMEFGLATDGEYCFHPVFSRAFGMTRRSSDTRVVYPANINLDDIYAD